MTVAVADGLRNALMRALRLLRALRSSRDLKAAPAIAITGHDNLRLRAEQAGYQGFMTNPSIRTNCAARSAR
jgi:CheY-like chemotaxis protein